MCKAAFDSKTLWEKYGIVDVMVRFFLLHSAFAYSPTQPFTESFPRASIYELITPDLLHQLIKGVFKDHLIDWVCKHLEQEHGKAKANSILDEIDRR